VRIGYDFCAFGQIQCVNADGHVNAVTPDMDRLACQSLGTMQAGEVGAAEAETVPGGR
jgi:hypothetical protein